MRPTSCALPVARRVAPWLLAPLVASLLCGCSVTAEDIETWKGTQKGPGKIVAVLLGPKYPIDLRSRAALALVEMQRSDVQSLTELTRQMRRLAPDPARPQIVGAMVEPLTAMMRAPNEGTPPHPPPLAVRAKDAAFVLLEFAAAADRTRFEDQLLDWVTADLNLRWLVGDHNTAEIVRGIGARSVPVLLRTITPEQRLLKNVCELVRDAGDPPGKLAAATRLAEIGQRQIPNVQNPTLEAMAVLGQRPVVDFLLGLAENAQVGDAQRTAALEALAGKVGPADVDRLVAIGANERAPADARWEALGLLGDRRDASILPRLWPLLATPEKRVRLQVGQLILNLGGPGAVNDFLRRLPATGRTEYHEDEVNQFSSIIANMTPPPLSVIRGTLVADSWIARLLSIRVIRQKGGREDLSILRELEADTTRIPGWDGTPAPTVGREAAEARRQLQGRVR